MPDAPRRLSDRPSLEQLRKQAKDLLAGYRAGDEAAAARFAAVVPRLADPDRAVRAVLADAQFVVAREHGFASWARLKARVADAVGRLNTTFFDVDLGDKRIKVRGPLSDADWDVVFRAIGDLRLTTLDAGEQMTDAVMARLPSFPHLTTIDLAGSRGLTDEGAANLARLPALTKVNLSMSGVTDRGLGVLRDLPALREFQLYHHGAVTDAGLAGISACPRLEFLDLMGTSTGDGVIQALAGHAALRRLHMGNGVTDAGLGRLHAIPAFKAWPGGEITFTLGGFSAEPTYLFLNLKSAITDRGLAALAGLDGLFAVNLFGTRGHAPFDDSRASVTADGVGHLHGLGHLGWLGCCAGLGTDAAMRHVAAMPQLRMLFGQDMVAGDDGFAALARSQTIECISGRRCYNLGDRGFAALADMPSLRGLSVSCRNVGDAGLSALPRFPALQELVAIDIGDAGYRHIGQCRTLETLWFGDGTTDAATAHVAALPALKHVSLAGRAVTDRSLDMLRGMPSLEVVELHNCRGVTSEGIARIAELPRLREVLLSALPRVTREGTTVFPPRVRVTYRN